MVALCFYAVSDIGLDLGTGAQWAEWGGLFAKYTMLRLLHKRSIHFEFIGAESVRPNRRLAFEHFPLKSMTNRMAPKVANNLL